MSPCIETQNNGNRSSAPDNNRQLSLTSSSTCPVSGRRPVYGVTSSVRPAIEEKPAARRGNCALDHVVTDGITRNDEVLSRSDGRVASNVMERSRIVDINKQAVRPHDTDISTRGDFVIPTITGTSCNSVCLLL